MNESQEKPLSCSPNVQVNEMPAQNSSSGKREKCVEAVFHLEDHLMGAAGGGICSLVWQLCTLKEEGNACGEGPGKGLKWSMTSHLADFCSELGVYPGREHAPKNVQLHLFLECDSKAHG